jgi:hypothetical protein
VAVAALPDGKILTVGGYSTVNGSGLSSAELYDPASFGLRGVYLPLIQR